MVARRVAAVVGGTALLAAWLGAAATRMAGLPVSEPAQGEPVRHEMAASEVGTEAQRLRARLSAAPAPRQPGRDPFRFADVRPAPGPARTVSAVSVSEEAAVAMAPDAALVSIAEHRLEEGRVRTVVIRVSGALYFLKAGEEQAGYRVAAIGDDAAEVLEVATGRLLRLTLR
jgi:hypothetical protein